ncbi:helix-turn-helix domain-containing protein [Azospirillum halopraeferens]|uniref:helix-turn-helix domain-containing protein n=1 Tax=Azospirillum halopraeferens TaxID=34010 RepID=UPI0004213585|nr:transcriptional regulator [Azospirillum halopraeferens]
MITLGMGARPMPADEKGLRKLVNVLKLRERPGMTQEAFAATYRIPLETLRDWEQRRKNPDATARAYLQVIDHDPLGVAAVVAPRAA